MTNTNSGVELSLAKKLGQKSIQNKIKDFLVKKDNSKPWVVEIDPTTACNLACHGCISANLLNQGGFKRERIKELAREFVRAGVKAAILIGGGEPMAHPEFGTIVDYFYENDIHVGVTTNGMLINKYLSSLANHTKWVRVSIDAGSEEVFQSYRPHISGKSQFKSIISQMESLSKRKKGKLGYSFVILTKQDKSGNFLDTNAVDISKAAKIAKDIGCNYFEVKPSFDTTHFLAETFKIEREIVKKELDKAKKLSDNNFSVISPVTISDAIEGNTTQKKDYKRCLVAGLRTVISPSGVYVCPYHRGNANFKIGDPNNESFAEIWSGEKRKKIMSELDPSKHCRFHCIRHDTNLILEDIDKGKKIKETLDYDRFL